VGDIYCIAGGGTLAPSTSGVAAGQSQLNAPQGLAVDAFGDLLVADVHNFALDVLAVSSSNPGYTLAPGASWTAGDVYQIAGGGNANASSAGSMGNQTRLYAPIGVATLPDGSFAMIDQGSKVLERLYLSPSIPQSPSAAAGDGTVTLTWSVPASTGGGAVSDYVAFVYDHGGAVPIETIDLGSTSTSATVSGLANGVAYDFSVEAFNALGTSAPSVKVEATPIAASTTSSTPPSTVPPTVPTTVPAVSSQSVPAAKTVPVRPHVAMVGGDQRVNAQGVPIAIRCRSGTCHGSITVTERHRVTMKSGGGSVTVIEVSVIARGTYRESSKSAKEIHVALTSFGRRLFSSKSRRGIAAVATVTTHGGPTVTGNLHIL
jgi:hypothetical protein